jgi:EAL domain-containing protein (putative c-di-GMP-specific phosphodiesterase class I)
MLNDSSNPTNSVNNSQSTPLTVQQPAQISSGCQRCEVVPDPIIGPGILHLRFPLSHTLGKARAALSQTNWSYVEERGTISIRIEDTDISGFTTHLCEVLSTPEQEDVRAIFQNDGRELEMQDFFEVVSLRAFAAQTQSAWLLNLLNQQRLTTWFQPIISCADSSVFAHECLMRGQENDKIIFPDRILNIARGANLLFQLDRAARLAAIREATRFKLPGKIFINFTPTSIYDPKNCLQTTLRAVDESSLSREQIVFEVIESENVGDPNHLREILDFYREQGFKVALDDVGSGYSSLNMISRLRPDFMKLDRELVSGLHRDNYKAMIAKKLLETAQELGIHSIAEGVEEEEEFQWLCENGTDFVQGYFIARPASPPPLLESANSRHIAVNA